MLIFKGSMNFLPWQSLKPSHCISPLIHSRGRNLPVLCLHLNSSIGQLVIQTLSSWPSEQSKTPSQIWSCKIHSKGKGAFSFSPWEHWSFGYSHVVGQFSSSKGQFEH